MKRSILFACLALTIALLGGCSSENKEGSVSAPDYLRDPVALDESLSVGHVTISYPSVLATSPAETHEQMRDDGFSYLCTQGSLHSEDWNISYVIEERTGMTLAQARAEAESEMSLPERYDELDDATKAFVDHTDWLSLEDTDEGFALTKTYDDAMLTMAHYYKLSNGDVASVSGSFPIEWYESAPNFFDGIFDSVVICDAMEGSAEGIWIPTETDLVYVDDGGVTWGYPYHPEGAPDNVQAFPDMLYTQGDNRETGYLNVAEHQIAVEVAKSRVPDEPGEYSITVTSNLYGFLSDEIVGKRTAGAFSTQPAETPEKSGNKWIPLDEGDVSTTSDNRTWGWWTADGSTDMEFVMATDTGRYGYIVAEERLAADSSNWAEYVNAGAKNTVVMLNVYLYDSQEIVGRYAVAMHAE